MTAAMTLLPGRVITAAGRVSQDTANDKLGWSEFEQNMTALAELQAGGRLDQQSLVERGRQYLLKLDLASAGFAGAVDASYETGNRYWLWQRMVKQRNVNGGILNINNEQLVQLHDHPGATGLLRIISGETEVWQFDQLATGSDTWDVGTVELVRVSRRLLKPGDTAVLAPDKGNIHALRAVTKECRMLDFFIPPYKSSQRSWFEPLTANWFEKEKVLTRKIPQHAYTKA